MNDVKKMTPYFLITLISYYGLSFMIKDTGSGIMILCIILPLITLLVAAAYGYQQQAHSFLYALITGAFFLPNIWIHMNDSAFVYPVIYMAFAFLGACIGRFLQKMKQQF